MWLQVTQANTKRPCVKTGEPMFVKRTSEACSNGLVWFYLVGNDVRNIGLEFCVDKLLGKTMLVSCSNLDILSVEWRQFIWIYLPMVYYPYHELQNTRCNSMWENTTDNSKCVMRSYGALLARNWVQASEQASCVGDTEWPTYLLRITKFTKLHPSSHLHMTQFLRSHLESEPWQLQALCSFWILLSICISIRS